MESFGSQKNVRSAVPRAFTEYVGEYTLGAVLGRIEALAGTTTSELVDQALNHKNISLDMLANADHLDEEQFKKIVSLVGDINLLAANDSLPEARACAHELADYLDSVL